mmetsp:Transcript_3066/g.8994  ORF Transcript_3066/g.8994 Transcript_3066/m.8994 type:complete len:253 (-) Transcript_3066:131-889(-)
MDRVSSCAKRRNAALQGLRAPPPTKPPSRERRAAAPPRRVPPTTLTGSRATVSILATPAYIPVRRGSRAPITSHTQPLRREERRAFTGDRCAACFFGEGAPVSPCSSMAGIGNGGGGSSGRSTESVDEVEPKMLQCRRLGGTSAAERPARGCAGERKSSSGSGPSPLTTEAGSAFRYAASSPCIAAARSSRNAGSSIAPAERKPCTLKRGMATPESRSCLACFAWSVATMMRRSFHRRCTLQRSPASLTARL